MKHCNYRNESCGAPATKSIRQYVKTDIRGKQIFRTEKVCGDCAQWHDEIEYENSQLSA